ncbi:MAG: malate:quinone oxidoreductase, partial [Candidatus Thermofonsia Clade 3 bacterium]
NSAASQNSQTLHSGDIETNYSLEQAERVKRAADMVLRYVAATAETGILHTMPKMVLAVGEAEVERLRARYLMLRALFPAMRWLGARGVAQMEPEVGRPDGRLRQEPLAALALPASPCAVDFAALAYSFLRQAARYCRRFTLKLRCPVRQIERSDAAWRLQLDGAALYADCVAVCAGAYSLGFAHRLDLGQAFSLLPVAGSFFYAPRRVRGKVYTLQSERLPFAAVHADPDILWPDRMRLGPTALILPLLERRRWRSLFDYLRLIGWDATLLRTLAHLMRERELRRYALRNLLYEVPGLRTHAFVHEAAKILPGLRASELRPARGCGGLRPQLIDKRAQRLYFGPAWIGGEGISFQVTPSPGASSCLAQAVEEAGRITAYLGRGIRREALVTDLGTHA